MITEIDSLISVMAMHPRIELFPVEDLFDTSFVDDPDLIAFYSVCGGATMFDVVDGENWLRWQIVGPHELNCLSDTHNSYEIPIEVIEESEAINFRRLVKCGEICDIAISTAGDMKGCCILTESGMLIPPMRVKRIATSFTQLLARLIYRDLESFTEGGDYICLMKASS
jgi:hypothetical protein